MLKILQSYIDVFFLLKLAKLNDSQYKMIYNDRSLMQKLEDNNLLDLFYMSKPLISENEINEELNLNKRKEANVQQIIDTNPIIKNFIDIYGEQFLDDRFVKGINRYYAYLVSKNYDIDNAEQIASGIENYTSSFKIKRFVYDYLDAKNSDIQFMLDFINKYIEIINLKNIAAGTLKMHKVCSLFYTMVNFILTSSEVYDTITEGFEDASKIRQSDTFDFILENYQKPQKIVQPQEIKDITPMSPQVINREDKTKK